MSTAEFIWIRIVFNVRAWGALFTGISLLVLCLSWQYWNARGMSQITAVSTMGPSVEPELSAYSAMDDVVMRPPQFSLGTNQLLGRWETVSLRGLDRVSESMEIHSDGSLISEIQVNALQGDPPLIRVDRGQWWLDGGVLHRVFRVGGGSHLAPWQQRLDQAALERVVMQPNWYQAPSYQVVQADDQRLILYHPQYGVRAEYRRSPSG